MSYSFNNKHLKDAITLLSDYLDPKSQKLAEFLTQKLACVS